MKIGDEIYVHGYIDEIRKDVVIIKNDGGYFGTVPSEITAFEQEPILDKIRAEIKAKIEEEEFARSVFRHEEKDTAKAEQCMGSIMAYNNVIKLIDKYDVISGERGVKEWE